MVIIDYREETVTKKAKNLDLIGPIKSIGVQVEKGSLEFGDAAFEGHGPKGNIAIAIERKGLHDLLHCIDDSRLSGYQSPGMRDTYNVKFLMVEGHWKPHDPQGMLMEGFNGGSSFGYCRYRSQAVMYSKVYRYLISVALSGIHVTYSRDPWHTAYNICEIFHYFQKPWHLHTSQQEMQKLNLPTLHGRPNLVRKWAADIEGIGTKLSADAERLFKKPITLANADEMEWLRIPGVGVKTAQSIVREIWGNK